MKYTIFSKEIIIPKRMFKELFESMRRSDQIAKAVDGKDEAQLLMMLAVEIETKGRTFVLERLYIKYKKARERREKGELIAAQK